MWLTLVPAYGRDYKTAEAVLAHWLDHKDFLISDVSCKWNGKYININDYTPGDTMKIRYDKLANFVLIKDGAIIGKEDGSELEEDAELV